MWRRLHDSCGWAFRLAFFLAVIYLFFVGMARLVDQIPIEASDSTVTTVCPS